MSHTPQEDLEREIIRAKEFVNVGGLYSHYKDPSKTYRVRDIVVLEADDALCVLYQANYGSGLSFVRPISSWLEKVEHEGKTISRFTPRFM